MGSIQLGAVIIGRTSSLLTATEGSMRCSIGTCLSKSSCDAVASLARANFLSNSRTRILSSAWLDHSRGVGLLVLLLIRLVDLEQWVLMAPRIPWWLYPG